MVSSEQWYMMEGDFKGLSMREFLKRMVRIKRVEQVSTLLHEHLSRQS